MRIKSEIWAMAYVRQCWSQGVPALVIRRGQSDAGAIFIKINTLDGNVELYGPAPAGLETVSQERMWSLCCGNGPVSEAEADSYLVRQLAFDPDIWILEVEDREGRNFLGAALVSDDSGPVPGSHHC